MNKLEHILIIDDDQINNVFSQIILEDANVGNTISTCQSVPEALDFLRNTEASGETAFPDLILLDITMPLMDGFDFLDSYYTLGYNERHQTFISMFSSSEDREHCKRLEKYGVVSGFIRKPLSISTLNNILARRNGPHVENNLP